MPHAPQPSPAALSHGASVRFAAQPHFVGEVYQLRCLPTAHWNPPANHHNVSHTGLVAKIAMVVINIEDPARWHNVGR